MDLVVFSFYFLLLIFSFLSLHAKVAELADAPDLGSGTARCGGSSPPFRNLPGRRIHGSGI